MSLQSLHQEAAVSNRKNTRPQTSNDKPESNRHEDIDTKNRGLSTPQPPPQSHPAKINRHTVAHKTRAWLTTS